MCSTFYRDILTLAEHLYGGELSWRSARNFGPDGDAESMARPVHVIADRLVSGVRHQINWNRGVVKLTESLAHLVC